jgi:dienelactone hydrolase
MMFGRACLFKLLILLFLATSASAESRLWGHLQPGRYAIGFRVAQVKGVNAELHIWYPAAQDPSATMTLGDYLRLSHDLVDAASGFDHDAVALRATLNRTVNGHDDLLDAKRADEILGLPMQAVRNARSASGRFPLVFWTHRYAVTSAQSVLNEYLASHGFVVVFAPQDSPPVMPFNLMTDEAKSNEFCRIVARMKRTLALAKRLPDVDSNKVAVIAWSYAGEAAFWLQQADTSVKLVVGLTTNVLDRWVYRPQELASLTGAKLTVPYVLIDGGTSLRPAVMTNAAARTFFVHINDMAHGSFNVLEGMVPSIMGISSVQPWSKAGPQQRLGFEVAMQYVRRSCEHYLKATPTLDTPFILWAPGDVPDDFVTVQQGGSAPTPPSQPQFSRVEFPSSDGITVTADLYSTSNKHAPAIVLVHQSGASRGEYRQIAPHLQQMGFNALAIDSRWGERDRWNDVTNETAIRAGTAAIIASKEIPRMRATQEAAAKDVRGALRWLAANGFMGKKLLWGSSISANLVLKLASASNLQVAAVLSFSPGEYHPDQPNEMASAVSKLAVPSLIACAEGEEATSKPIFDAVQIRDKVFYRAPVGKHASSILIDDPENWNGIVPFLRRFRDSR